MTITTNDVRDEYTASAAQTVFNYTFKIFADGQLDVYITPSGQEADDSTDITTAYTIDPSSIGEEDGGFITLDSGTSSGDLVTIVSNIPEARTTDYQNSGDFLPDVVNDDFDTVVSLVKQVEDKSNRTLAFQSSLQNATALTLPAPSAGLFMVWNGTETGLENTGVPSVVVPGDLSGTLTALKSATNLTIGDFVVTTGFNANGDGGDNTYEIVAASTGTDDGGSFIDLAGSGLQAKALFPKGFVNLKQFGPTGLGGNNDEQPQIQVALNYAVANKMRLHCPSPSVTYAMAAEVNLNEFLGQQDLNVQISGEGFSSNYVDGGSSSLFTHVDGYTGFLFDLSISIAPATSWFTLVMDNINLWGKNVNLGDGMRVIGCHYFLNNVGMNELDRAFRPEQCFRGDVRGCSIARNNTAIQFAGYCSATTFSGSTIRGNTTAVEFAAGYPSTFGNDNRLDNVNFLFNNMESNGTIFDIKNGRTTHVTVKYNYAENIGGVLFDCSNGTYDHYNLKFVGMSNQQHVLFNKCRDVELIGESIILDSFSVTNSINLIIKNSDTIDAGSSTASMALVPGNVTDYTLNDDPDFTLHSLMRVPFVLPREWSASSLTPTYTWDLDSPYGYSKRVLKYDGASGSMSLTVPLKEPKLDTFVYGLVSIRVETGVAKIGFQIDGGSQNFGTPLTVDASYQQETLRIPVSAGDSELKIIINGDGGAAVFYIDAVILGYSLYPQFRQSESFTAQVTVPTGAGLSLLGGTDLLVQATPEGATVMMGVNDNGTTTPDIVHSGGGDIDATLLVTPREHVQKWRVR